MALFDKTSKEDKQAQKLEELLNKYGLENVRDPETAEQLRKITSSLSGSKLLDAGIALSGRPEEVAKISYLRAIVEQNFLIIKLLDKLVK